MFAIQQSRILTPKGDDRTVTEHDLDCCCTRQDETETLSHDNEERKGCTYHSGFYHAAEPKNNFARQNSLTDNSIDFSESHEVK